MGDFVEWTNMGRNSAYTPLKWELKNSYLGSPKYEKIIFDELSKIWSGLQPSTILFQS